MKKTNNKKNKTEKDLYTICRYSCRLIKGMSIKDCLQKNDWLYNQSFNIFAFYNKAQKLPPEAISMEKMWCTENYILYSGTNTCLNDYLDILDWDSFGTWFINLFPNKIEVFDTRFPGVNTFLPIQNAYTRDEYYELNDEWKFIHDVGADIIISRQPNGILFGALSELNLFSINTI